MAAVSNMVPLSYIQIYQGPIQLNSPESLNFYEIYERFWVNLHDIDIVVLNPVSGSVMFWTSVCPFTPSFGF